MPAKGQERMDDTALWRPHLKPGERIVWSAAASDALRRADQSRVRLQSGAWAIATGGLAIFSGYRFYEAVFTGTGQPDLSAAVAAPLFFALAAALGAASAFLFARLGIAPPPERHYAATNLRLMSAGADGQLSDEIAAADIAGAMFDNDRKPASILVLRRNDDASETSFCIEYVDDLAAVRTMINATFPEPAP